MNRQLFVKLLPGSFAALYATHCLPTYIVRPENLISRRTRAYFLQLHGVKNAGKEKNRAMQPSLVAETDDFLERVWATCSVYGLTHFFLIFCLISHGYMMTLHHDCLLQWEA
jgi:hypothetical protein